MPIASTVVRASVLSEKRRQACERYALEGGATSKPYRAWSTWPVAGNAPSAAKLPAASELPAKRHAASAARRSSMVNPLQIPWPNPKPVFRLKDADEVTVDTIR